MFVSFTTDNWSSAEFDPFGFSMQDLPIQKVLLRCESSSDLYSLPATFNKTPFFSTTLLASTPELWHKRLGHINQASLHSVFSSNPMLCNKGLAPISCEPCYLGKSIKQPFLLLNLKYKNPST